MRAATADHLRPRLDFSPRIEISGGSIAALGADSGGRVYATGSFSGTPTGIHFGLLRLLPDGATDVTFRPPPLLGGAGGFIHVLPDQRILVAGTFLRLGLLHRPGLARFFDDGSVDLAFEPNVTSGWTITAVAPGPNGTTYVAGSHRPDGLNSRNSLVRLQADGSVDPAFVAHAEFTDPITQLAARSDGSVYANGRARRPAEPAGPGWPVDRLLPDGALDSAYVPVVRGQVTAIALQADGRLLLGGNIYDGAIVLPAVVRLTSEGMLDATFVPGGLDLVDPAYPAPPISPMIVERVVFVASHPEGDLDVHVRWVWSSIVTSYSYDRFLRLRADGARDTAFAPDIGFPCVGVSLGGSAVVVASSDGATGPLRRLDRHGVVDTSYVGEPLRMPGVVRAVEPVPAGGWVLAGSFDFVDGVPRRHLARIRADGSLDPEFDPGTGLPAPIRLMALLTDGRIITHEDSSVARHILKGQYVTYPLGRFVRLSASGVRESSYGTGYVEGHIRFIRAMPAGEMIVGYGTLIGYGPDLDATARRLPDSGNLSDAQPADNRGVGRQLLPLPDGTYIAAEAPDPLMRPTLLRLQRHLAGGAVDPGFASETMINADAILLARQPDGRLLAAWNGGPASLDDALSPRRIARFMPDGGFDPSFDTGTGFHSADGSASLLEAVLPQDDGTTLVAGSFITCDGHVCPGLARLRPDGRVDPTFLVDDLPTAPMGVRTLTSVSDGSLLAGGEWTYFAETGTFSMGLAMLQSTARPRVRVQPVPVRVTAGGSATFSAQADSSLSIIFQWQYLAPSPVDAVGTAAREWVDIAGATGAVFTLLSAQPYHAGSYRVVVTAGGVSTTSSPATLEVVPAPASEAQLLNLSARGFVGTGQSVLIPGIVVSSEGARTILVRCCGPALAAFGVDGALADPVLTIFDGADRPILSNDDWGGGSSETAAVSAAVGAFPLPEGSRDSAFVVTLQPGSYTIQATGKDNSTGIALVEVYLVP